MSPIDPETLKVPTFMRRRTIKKRIVHLPATALDRKLATKKHRKRAAVKPTRRKVASVAIKVRPLVRTKQIATQKKKIHTVAKLASREVGIKARARLFTPEKKSENKKSEQVVGKITHYYDQIKVCVIKLKSPVAVGDTIHIVGSKNDFTQVITSMQMNHEEITKAKKGDDIGLKLKKEAKQGDVVYRTE